MAPTSSHTADAPRAGAFYIRISKEGQRSESEVAAQLKKYQEQCERFAQRKGLDTSNVRVVTETDVSGGLALDERKLGPLVLEVESGALAWIMSPDVDRFGRDTYYGLDAWRRVVAAGGRLLFADEDIDSGETDYGDPQKDFEQALVQGSAYRRKVARRFSGNVEDALLERGIHAGPRAPYGYIWPGVCIDLGNGKVKFKKTGPLVPTAEASAETLASARAQAKAQGVRLPERKDTERVRLAFERFGATENRASWSQVNAILGGTDNGGARNILKSRVYLGEARAVGEKLNLVKEGAHDALVDLDTWERCQRRLTEARRDVAINRRGSRKARTLSKILRCCGCGGVLGPDSTHWRCKRSGCTNRGVGITEAIALPWVIAQAKAAHEFLNLGVEVDRASLIVYEEAERDALRKAVEAAAALGLDVADLPAHSKPMQALTEARAALRRAESEQEWAARSPEDVAAIIEAGDPAEVNRFLLETLRVFVARCGRHAAPEDRAPEARCRVVVLDGSFSPETMWPLPVGGKKVGETTTPVEVSAGVIFPGPVEVLS